MIHLTEQAAKHIKILLSEKKNMSTHGLRLTIEQGGCAGLQYSMILGAAETGDEVIEQNNAKVFIDTKSFHQLDGATIDYEEGLTGTGFRIINPQAVRSCGCGTSFEPKEID